MRRHVPAGVADDDAVGGGQRRRLPLRAEQRADLADRLLRLAPLQRQDHADQFVLAPFAQFGQRHVRDEVRRDALVDIGDDQEPVAADQHVSALQQVAVQDVQRLRRGVLAVVKVIEGARRNRTGVQRQPGELRKLPQHRLPGGEAKVEAHRVRLALLRHGLLRHGVWCRVVRRRVLRRRGGHLVERVGCGRRLAAEVDRGSGAFRQRRVELAVRPDLLPGDQVGPAAAVTSPVTPAVAAGHVVGRLRAELLLVARPLLGGQLREHGLFQLFAELRIPELAPVAGGSDLLDLLLAGLAHRVPLRVRQAEFFRPLVTVEQAGDAAGPQAELLVPFPLIVGEHLRGLLLELLAGGPHLLADLVTDLLALLVGRGVAEPLADGLPIHPPAGGLTQFPELRDLLLAEADLLLESFNLENLRPPAGTAAGAATALSLGGGGERRDQQGREGDANLRPPHERASRPSRGRQECQAGHAAGGRNRRGPTRRAGAVAGTDATGRGGCGRRAALSRAVVAQEAAPAALIRTADGGRGETETSHQRVCRQATRSVREAAGLVTLGQPRPSR